LRARALFAGLGHGKTVFSFNDIPRYNERQLRLYQAHKMGDLAADVAAELMPFVRQRNDSSGPRCDREDCLTGNLQSLCGSK
jgi:hypothetical protein